MKMTIEEVKEFIAKTKAFGSKPGLERITELMRRLCNVQEDVPAVHVAGTNGKGSVSSFLSNILIASGKKTGLYTSPAIGEENERIKINNVPINDKNAAEVFSDVKAACDEMVRSGFEHPTEFEVINAAAFLYFKREGCNIAVLETGMGGRLDSTNVIKAPLLSIITSISFDHITYLGNTLEKIAAEKAGIIKKNCPVLIFPQVSAEVTEVFENKALSGNSPFHIASDPELIERDLTGQSFSVKGLSLKTSLLGTYQVRNAAAAAEAAMLLGIEDNAIKKGIADTRWEARFEMLSKEPFFFSDGGHNEEGAKVLFDSLKAYFPDKKIIFISGVLADKDYKKMFETLLPIAECFFTITPKTPRALSAEALSDYLSSKYKAPGFSVACSSVKEAVEKALKRADRDDVICSFGSLYFQGEVRALFQDTNFSSS